jgi:hypothetical protein
MQFLYRRHPEIGMGIELLIKPGGSGFMGADTEKIGACIARRTFLSVLMSALAAASVEWPIPFHVSMFPCWNPW